MPPKKLDLEKEFRSGDTTVITRLSGRLALETVHDFIETLRPEPAPHLVLDMTAVTFVDSAGVGALVSLFVSRKNHGKTFALACLNQQAKSVIEVASLTNYLPIFSSLEQAAARSS